MTLLWNEDSGFRVMMERIGETCRSVKSNLPFPWFCFTNPELNKWALRKLRARIEEAGATMGYSNSRTCEIGLTHHSGIPYMGIVYLVNRAASARA